MLCIGFDKCVKYNFIFITTSLSLSLSSIFHPCFTIEENPKTNHNSLPQCISYWKAYYILCNICLRSEDIRNNYLQICPSRHGQSVRRRHTAVLLTFSSLHKLMESFCTKGGRICCTRGIYYYAYSSQLSSST